MGAKTFEGDHHQHESTTTGAKPQSEGKPRGAHFAEDGDGDYGNDDDEDDRQGADTLKKDSSKKKKRKKSKKKQTFPPRVPLADLFKSGVYPEGEVTRITNEELRYNSRPMDDDFLNNYRKAGEVHRQVRQWVHETAKPGISLNVIAEGIEDGVRALLQHQGLEPGDSLKAGMGFPTGLPLNNCAAHYTPNPGQKEVILQADDVMKVDFGVHINGWIVDSAFTVAFNPVYDNLLAAVKDATNTGIKNTGIDARICEVSAAIQEAMESYEVELNGKTIPIKAVRNITGHNIKPYRIHGGKSIPFVKNDDQTKMEEGEVFAIETFGTTGKGYLRDEPGIYGYGKVPNAHAPLGLASARSLLKTINENFGTLVFCRRYLERLGASKYLAGLNSLVANGILDSYAPLSDVPGSYTAQFEHTILLRPNAKEVVSRGDDY